MRMMKQEWDSNPEAEELSKIMKGAARPTATSLHLRPRKTKTLEVFGKL